MTTLYLLRHAESCPTPDVPEPEWGLSANGTNQAEALVERLRPLGITRIYSSPFERAVATARPFAQATGIEIQIVEGLKERRLGGTSFLGDRFHDTMSDLWGDLNKSLDGGESGYACQERVVNAINQIATRNIGETILIASHGQALTLFLNTIDNSIGRDFWANMKNPDLFRIAVTLDSDDLFVWDRGPLITSPR